MKMKKQIDPSAFDANHPLSVAMRSVSRHWFLAYSKLMSLRWEWDSGVTYGATDGRTLYLNPTGIEKLCRIPNASGLIAFLLVHESLHALLGHGWRSERMVDKESVNVAADYIINAMIAARNRELGREVFPLTPHILLDETLSGDKSLEQLYRELTKPQPKPEPQPQPNQTNESNDTDDDKQDDPSTGDDDSDDAPDPDSGGSPDEGDSESGPRRDGPAESDNGVPADPDSDSGDMDLSDFVGTGSPDNLPPQVGDGEQEQDVVNEIEEANDGILLSNEIDSRTNSNAGQVGKRVANQRHRASALSWPEMLREWLNRRSRNGWDSPFNPAVHSATELICAGRRTKAAGDIVLVVDTSGSVGQETYDRFLYEAQCVLDEVKPERLHLLSVSHIVADSVSLDYGQQVPDRMKGGGGTRFQPAFDWIGSNVDGPDVVVYLTDGWSDDLPELAEPDYPLLWLCTSRAASDFKTGEVISINEF